MSVQNPTIPTATQAKAIDNVILDLQTHLDTELVWLTNGMGRAYRLSKVRTNQTTVFLPEVYLGVANRYDYFAATPDNDKQGQNVMFVGDATLPDQQKGFYGWVEHEVGIIFSANLELIDSALLVTEDFTEHLIQDVREALIRDLVGKSYRLNIDSITRDFDDVYAEFDVSQDRGIAHAPMTHFRVNCTITFREDCAGVSLDRCGAILQNLSNDDKLNCILPTYDFSDTATQNATTGQQQTDLTAWLCVTPPTPNVYSLDFDGTDEYVLTRDSDPSYDLEYNAAFSISFWIKPSILQEGHIINKFLSPTGYFVRISATGEIRLGLYNNGVTNGIDVKTSTAVVTTGAWYHVCVTYDGSSNASGVKFYINNSLKTNSVTADTLSASIVNAETLTLGAYTFAGRYYAGLLDEVRMWDIELNASQVATEYNSGSATADVNETLNNFLAFGAGDDSIFGITNRHFPDRVKTSATLTGFYNSMNMEAADLKTDVS